MKRKLLGLMAVPLVAACLTLANCSGKTTTTQGPTTAYAVLRLKTDGTPDTTFAGGRGIAITDIDPAQFDFALAVAIEPAPSNKIIAAGSSGLAGQGVIALVRYNVDGSLDAGFGTGGIVRTPTPTGWTSASATAIAVQPADSKIVVAALTFNATTGNTGIELLRYTATTGALDTTFGMNGIVNPVVTIGPGLVSDTCALALQPDGKIVVAGASQSGNIVLNRYDATGALDPNFGTSGTGGQSIKSIGTLARPPALALQSTGKIIVATGNDVDQVLLRFGTDGVSDTGFGGTSDGIVNTVVGSGVNYANAVAVQQVAGSPALSDKIVVAGHANLNFNLNTSDISLVRYNADGTPDTTFNTTGTVITDLGGKFDNALSIVLQPQPPQEPLILVSGNTGSAGFSQMAVLRYNPDGMFDATFGPGGVVIVQLAGPSNIASGNAVALEPVGAGVGIVVAGYD